MLLYLSNIPGIWRYAVLDLFALVYFYIRWSSPEAQHRQFHFLLMWSYGFTTAFYAYQFFVSQLAPEMFAGLQWSYQLASNILFECELLLIFTYSLLRRRAQKDKAQYRSDVAGWFQKAGALKRAIGRQFRRVFPRTDKS